MSNEIDEGQMADDFASIPDPGAASALAAIRNADRLRGAIDLLSEGERTMGNEERVQWKKRVGIFLKGIASA